LVGLTVVYLADMMADSLALAKVSQLVDFSVALKAGLRVAMLA
jgi:hypothetical protein